MPMWNASDKGGEGLSPRLEHPVLVQLLDAPRDANCLRRAARARALLPPLRGVGLGVEERRGLQDGAAHLEPRCEVGPADLRLRVDTWRGRRGAVW